MGKFLLIIAALASLTWWYWGRTLEPAAVVQAHLEAVGKHDYPKAYSYLSRTLKARLSLDDFRDRVKQNPTVDNNYTSEFLSRSMHGGVLTLSGNIRSFNREKTSATYTVVKEGQRWVIQQFQF